MRCLEQEDEAIQQRGSLLVARFFGRCCHKLASPEAVRPVTDVLLNDLPDEPLATTRYFYALTIHGAILPQNKQILCRYFTIKQHRTIFSRETKTDWQRADS
jgi:hypothetical protein